VIEANKVQTRCQFKKFLSSINYGKVSISQFGYMRCRFASEYSARERGRFATREARDRAGSPTFRNAIARIGMGFLLLNGKIARNPGKEYCEFAVIESERFAAQAAASLRLAMLRICDFSDSFFE